MRFGDVLHVKLFLLLISKSFGGDLYEGNNCRTKSGRDGVCTKLPECTSIYNALQSGKASFSSLTRCSFIGVVEVICCEDRTPVSITRVSTSTQIPGQIIFEPNFGIWTSTTSKPPALNLNTNFTDLSLAMFQESVTTSTSGSHISIPTTSPNISWTTIQQNLQDSGTSFDGKIWDTFSTILATQPTSTENPTRLWENIFTKNSTQENFVISNSNSLHGISKSPSTTGIFVTFPNHWITDISKNKKESIKQISTPTSSPGQQDSTVREQPLESNLFFSKIITTPSSITNTYSSILDPWMVDALQIVNTTQKNYLMHESITLHPPDFSSISDNHNEINPSKNLRYETTELPNPNLHPSPVSRSGRKAVTACEQYSQDASSTLTFHILEGVPSALGEFPHMAALGYPSLSAGEDITWDCGGSLISDKFVLTAAHCANREDRRPSVIRLGAILLNSTVENQSHVDAKISEIFLHPAYTPSRQYNDIALIQLDKPVTISSNIRPACLYTNLLDINPNERLIATGWGAVSLKTRMKSSVLLQTNLTAINLSSCNQSHVNYGVSRRYPNGLDQGQLCAFDPELRTDACEGDSGGPLQMKNKQNIYTIVGVTSFGIGCGTEIPGVYARVAYYIDWIESIVWK